MNNIKDLFFYIHYCNSKKIKDAWVTEYNFSRKLSHNELIYICSGSGSFKIKGKRYTIKKGMLIYISPETPYTIELDRTVPVSFLTVHFSFAQVVFNNGKWGINTQGQIFTRSHIFELGNTYLIEKEFQKLVNCWYQKLPGYELISKTTLHQLLIIIAQNLNKRYYNFSSSAKVEKIIQHMQSNINGKITLSGLSRIVQISPAYMSRIFKDITEYTIIEYFNKLKIDKSKELLIEGNKKVKEVSQELGFADEFYFSRMFKRMEGITPSQFYSRIVHGY